MLTRKASGGGGGVGEAHTKARLAIRDKFQLYAKHCKRLLGNFGTIHTI